jgi:hypothetical protein
VGISAGCGHHETKAALACTWEMLALPYMQRLSDGLVATTAFLWLPRWLEGPHVGSSGDRIKFKGR